MFWSLGHFSSPTIDTILDREGGFTLEELLDEDELLQECKAQNAKLTEFLTQPATLSKLIGFMTEMPAASDTEARCYKYPYVASEILSCDMVAVRDAVFAAPALLTQLLSILELPAPLPPVLAGYACKVVTALQKLNAASNGAVLPGLLQQLLAGLPADKQPGAQALLAGVC